MKNKLFRQNKTVNDYLTPVIPVIAVVPVIAVILTTFTALAMIDDILVVFQRISLLRTVLESLHPKDSKNGIENENRSKNDREITRKEIVVKIIHKILLYNFFSCTFSDICT